MNGVYSVAQKLDDGRLAARPQRIAFRGVDLRRDRAPRPRDGTQPTHPCPIIDHPKGKNFVDFDEDLQVKDFFNAAQEGFDNIELLKRYSTVGMGPIAGQAFEHERDPHPCAD